MEYFPLYPAVTVVSLFIVTTQLPVPEHPPPVQPVKIESEGVVAVNVTTVPLMYSSEQSSPQLMPGGELVTVAIPLPVLITVRERPSTTVPLNGALNMGVRGSLDGMVRAALFSPADVGEKTTWTTQLSEAAIVPPLHPSIVLLNSLAFVPVGVIDPMTRPTVPVFDKMNDWAMGVVPK
jgi:hypothetical protein